MIGPIHHATLSVTDLDRSIEFYRDIMGFRLTVTGVVDDEEHDIYLRLPAGLTGHVAVMQSGKHALGAVELIEWSPPQPTTAPKRPGDPGVCLLAFEVTGETLADVYARLVDQGIECWSEPMPVHVEGYGDIAAVVFEDPDGVMIELLTLPSLDEARRARRAWLASRDHSSDQG